MKLMDGKTCLITGATSGIGEQAALALAKMGALVVVVARNRQRGEATLKKIREAAGPEAGLLVHDLQSRSGVAALAEEFLEKYERLDVLINNAGLTIGKRELTEDGLEMTFAVNHMAPFLLTKYLRPLLEKSAPSRIVTVASDAHRQGKTNFEDLNGERKFSGWAAYCQSKLANILFTRELARQLKDSGVTANCLHPGVVATRFAGTGPLFIRFFFLLARPFLVSPARGAETIVYLASSPDVAGVSGRYFAKKRRAKPTAAALDMEAAKRLWQLSEDLVQ